MDVKQIKESKESVPENLWKWVCNNDFDRVTDYYENGGEVNKKYPRFGTSHSLIMGAVRNNYFDMANLLAYYGETVSKEEEKEILKKFENATDGSDIIALNTLLDTLNIKEAINESKEESYEEEIEENPYGTDLGQLLPFDEGDWQEYAGAEEIEIDTGFLDPLIYHGAHTDVLVAGYDPDTYENACFVTTYSIDPEDYELTSGNEWVFDDEENDFRYNTFRSWSSAFNTDEYGLSSAIELANRLIEASKNTTCSGFYEILVNDFPEMEIDEI